MKRAIDVSKWEGTYALKNPPNWAGAKLDGVELGIVKVTQKSVTDETFEFHWNAMKRMGIKRSGYHFWSPTDTDYQAELFGYSLMGAEGGLDFPPILDFEPSLTTYPTRISGIDIKIKAFLDKIELRTGMKPMIYTGVPYWNKHFPTKPAWLGDYKLWLAAYPYVVNTSKNQWDLARYSYAKPLLPIGWTYDQLILWQFTDKGIITGFAGSTGIDLSHWYPAGFNIG